MEEHNEFKLIELPNPTREQKEIIEKISKQNLVVDAVAGSGKTTLGLHIAKKYPKKKIVVLTYNSKLKKETRDKIKELNLTNIEAHSYHAFGYKYYKKGCKNDSVLRKIIKNNIKPIKYINFDILIVDESQDLKLLFYKLILKLCKDNIKNKEAKICIMGDKNQTIYQIYGADSRYLTLAPKIFNINNFSWDILPLHYTWRLSKSITTFVNKVVLKKDRLKTMKVIDKPIEYKIMNIFGEGISTFLKETLSSILRNYKDNEICILAPTIKTKVPTHPINQICNYLSKYKHPIYKETKDINYSIDSKNNRYSDNKILISNYHQSKGLERKCVIVFNFDESYFKYFATNECNKKCTNPLYVALTRASEKLILIHHYKNNYLPFINIENLKKIKFKKYFNVEESKILCDLSNTINNRLGLDVISLIQKATICDDLDDNILNFFSIKKLQKNLESMKFKWSYTNKKTKTIENISHIIGIAIPMYLSFKKNNNFECYKIMDNICYDMFKIYEIKNIEKIIKHSINNKNIEISDLMYLATFYYCKENYIRCLLDQINENDYKILINDKQLKSCYEKFKKKFKDIKNTDFEYYIEGDYDSKSNIPYQIHGSIDCITDNNCIWEFKCTSELSLEHKIQCGIYMWLYYKKYGKVLKCKLMNFETNELLLIESTSDKLNQFIDNIFLYYEKKRNVLSDDIFIENCNKLKKEYNFNKISKKNNICHGYPLIALKEPNKPTISDRKEWKSLDDFEKANAEYWFEKEKSEDPITKKKIFKNTEEWFKIDKKYNKWGNVIKRNWYKQEKGDYKDIIKHIDNNKNKLVFYKDGCFKTPILKGGIIDKTYKCSVCNEEIDFEDGDEIFCENCDLSINSEDISNINYNNNVYMTIKDKREFKKY